MKRKAESGHGRRKANEAGAKRKAWTHASGGFPIVGVGASAGGLEALEHFLRQVPPGSGMAFVLVPHLDPTHKGIMPELLQRATTMRVVQTKDRTPVRPDCVYVIPPNRDMSILHGVLHLLAPSAPRGLRLPIDFFLRSLAQDQQERSVGVILSGMGSDGALGLRSIKEKAGLVLVQDPATAKFDGMPRSAIDAGLADIVAPVEELPAKILAYHKRTPLIIRAEPAIAERTQNALEKVVILLRARTGHDFSLYKRNTLYRRIERRMGVHQIAKIDGYVRYLQENSQELTLLFKELLIGVTSFFRDPGAWDQLRDQGFAGLFASRQPKEVLRAWIPGCASGEEAYSMAISFKEALEQAKPKLLFRLQIFATDLDQDSIERARQGVYPPNIAADVSPERLRRFFVKEEQGYRVRKEIREMVIFALQNLIMDPPFTKLDMLCCRNLLIYLAPEVQKRLFPLFHYSLRPGGVLFLGSAETIGTFTNLFVPVNAKAKIFRRGDAPIAAEAVEFPAAFPTLVPSAAEPPRATKPSFSFQTLVDQMILRRYAAPVVVVTEKGDILYVSGKTGKFLEPAVGKANWNIFAMARNGLRYELTSAFQRALRQKVQVTMKGIKFSTEPGESWLDLTVEALEEPEALRGLVMVVFVEVPAAAELRQAAKLRRAGEDGPKLAELEQELQQAREELQTTREEMQTSQEELKSTNEELQSANEELQSTNEELTASKEEMQSLNEELQTVNAELQGKVDALSVANSDMKNLLNSTEIATLFLDNDLHVRRFTTAAAKIIKLIPGDVGRPVTDLAMELRYPDLARDATEVLRTLVSTEKPIASRDGRWFSVRIMPYRTQDNRIEGVVITFTESTALKRLEAESRKQRAELERMERAGTAAAGGPKRLREPGADGH